MLNGYFAFGVPFFLILLYLIVEWIRKKSHIQYYLGFILLLIASFLTVFSFQVLQEFWSADTHLELQLGYSPDILWLPLIIGLLLVVLNCWRGIRRIYQFQQERKEHHPN
ncbi:hypothetical protein [uncultured Enterococcus sp.]|uniref:hypothetical protein n=1 Tax=uncultured Enterococcus sp. TaxID=167972 RepID=UPI002AA7F4F6|nr:hypothetical protein [uncultured Enterococcus sp.]